MVQVSEFVRDARHGAVGARGQGAGGAQHRHPDVEPARQHGVQGLMQCSLRVSCLSIGQIWQRKIYQLISKSRLHLFTEDIQQISAKAQLLSLAIVMASWIIRCFLVSFFWPILCLRILPIVFCQQLDMHFGCSA